MCGIPAHMQHIDHTVVQAAAYYAQAKNSEALADALYRLEDFDGLEQLTAALPEETPLLLHLGGHFQSVGLCQQAAAAYIKVRCCQQGCKSTRVFAKRYQGQTLQIQHVLLTKMNKCFAAVSRHSCQKSLQACLAYFLK